jgi:8-oxo-dGTP pyrophosphatase MutT (NUDIX family)
MNNIDLNEIIRDGGYYDKLGQWNSVVRKPGSNHLYRQRVETLVIRNDDFGTGYVFVKKNGDDYDLPGGSIEPNVPDETQAANECHEEIHVDVKNIRYAYVDYESPIPENV